MRKISVKWQLLASFLAFVFGLLILVWVFQIGFLDNFYKNIRLNDVEQASQLIANKLHYNDWEEELLDISNENEISILLLDEKYNCILIQNGRTSYPDINFNQIRLIDLIRMCKEKGGKITFNTSEMVNQGIELPFDRNDSIVQVRSIIVSGKEIYFLISANLLPVESTVNTLSKQLFVISIIMVTAASVVAFMLAKKISTPIINLNRKSRYLAEGNYEFEFIEEGYQEIEELSETLNYANRELKKIDSLQKELISNVSHDLKTPLTMIRGYAEMMRDFKDEVTEDNMNVIIDETIHLTNLVNNILDLSKIQSGVSTNILEVFSLTEMIENTISRYNQLLEVNKYHIDFLFEEEIYVNSDKSKLLQVIYNLLNNAINYIGEDKTVIIKQSITEFNKVKIEIIDHGIGIPKEKIKDIWDRYYKVDKTHKRANSGFGLGLSMVKAILESLNLEYGVISEENKGSNFYFILEIEKEDYE